MPLEHPDVLLRLEDAARLLGLGHSTVRRLIAQGAIAVVRLTPKAVRIAESEIVRLQREGLRSRSFEEGRE